MHLQIGRHLQKTVPLNHFKERTVLCKRRHLVLLEWVCGVLELFFANTFAATVSLRVAFWSKMVERDREETHETSENGVWKEICEVQWQNSSKDSEMKQAILSNISEQRKTLSL